MLTTKERMQRMYDRKTADRIPITDSFWDTTIARWRREGMPKNVSVAEYFGLDQFAGIGVDISPRYPQKIIEETDDYVIRTTNWGATQKEWKNKASTPAFLDFTVKTQRDWEQAKARMTTSDDRIPWDYLKKWYPEWQKEGAWIQAGLWFGFDVTHSWFIGTERLLIAMLEQPQWCADIFDTFLERNLTLLDRIWDAGYRFDGIRWPDDMGYKNSAFFSVSTYRELIKPVQKKAIEWAHQKGLRTMLHSCGNITALVPDLINIGLDGLNPLEVKAGMDPLAMKRKYGDQLLLQGGIDVMLWTDADRVQAEIERVVPTMMQGGGYVFSSDHSVPESISLEDYRQIVKTAKKYGSYDAKVT